MIASFQDSNAWWVQSTFDQWDEDCFFLIIHHYWINGTWSTMITIVLTELYTIIRMHNALSWVMAKWWLGICQDRRTILLFLNALRVWNSVEPAAYVCQNVHIILAKYYCTLMVLNISSALKIFSVTVILESWTYTMIVIRFTELHTDCTGAVFLIYNLFLVIYKMCSNCQFLHVVDCSNCCYCVFTNHMCAQTYVLASFYIELIHWNIENHQVVIC